VIAWSDISIDQGHQLLPEARGKKQLFASCMGCHGFQTKMANGLRDEEGWRDRMNYMRTAMGFSLGIPRRPFTDEQADDVVYYLNHVFGYESDKVMPASPADLPGYAATVRSFPDEALKIVYVTYDMPGPGRMPWTAAPDKDGKFWIAEYGNANKIARLDPVSGEMVEFPVPNPNSAAIHSAVPAPDGSVWLTERGGYYLGRWDPQTQKVEEFKDTWDKHTARVAQDGTVWSTGGMTKFDPKTKEFTHIAEIPNVYGLAEAKDGTLWFAENIKDGHIGKIDPKTYKVTKYFPPSTQQPRRIQVAADGMVWFAGLQRGKIAKFDPASEKFTEFALPGPHASPYALGITNDYQVGYSSEHQDVVGRLDPESAKVVEYPIPFSDNGMRDFFKDAQGRLWFGSPPNDLVGYFYLADNRSHITRTQ
jgi:streptogramin lyase